MDEERDETRCINTFKPAPRPAPAAVSAATLGFRPIDALVARFTARKTVKDLLRASI